MHVFGTCILIFIVPMLHKIHGETCGASIPTEQIVRKCPQSKEDLRLAAARKQCKQIATNQSCSKPEDFVYHCLPKEDGTDFVEVCAPIFLTNGYCAKYDTKEHRVNNFIEHDCTKHNPPCKIPFNSTEAYNYPSCYDLVQKNKITSMHKCSEESNAQNVYLPAILGTVLAVSIVINVLLLLYCLLKHARSRKKREKDNVSSSITKMTNQVEKKIKKADISQDGIISAAEKQKFDTQREKEQLSKNKSVQHVRELFESGSDPTYETPKSKPTDYVRTGKKETEETESFLKSDQSQTKATEGDDEGDKKSLHNDGANAYCQEEKSVLDGFDSVLEDC